MLKSLLSLVSITYAAAATPGALTASLNTTSVNNMLKTFIPIMSYFMLNNKTIECDIKESSFLYSLDIKSIHIDTVSGIQDIKFEEIAGTDKMHVHMDKIDASIEVDGTFKGLHFIPMDATKVIFKGASIDFTVESTAPDKVHWALIDSSKFSIESAEITMKSKFLQKLVDMSKKLVDKMINDQMPKIGKAIDEKIGAFNTMIANEGPSTFVFPVYGKDIALNMTMTNAPVTEVDSDLINLYFNGLFVGQGETQTIADITTYPARMEHSLSEQIWIHEDTLDSLFEIAGSQLFPVEIKSVDVAQNILQVFPEIQNYYGNDVTVHLHVTMNTDEGKAINLDAKHGIIFGSQQTTCTTLQIIATNASTPEESAVTFDMNMEAHANVTMKDFVMWPSFKEVFAANTKVTQDKVGMQSHSYNILMTAILQKAMAGFNAQYVNGWPLSNLSPEFEMLSGLLKNSTITPYVAQNLLYAGFTMYADMPTEEPVLAFLQ